MKKIIVLLLVGVVCFSLTACEEGAAKSTLETDTAAKADTAAESAEEDEFEIPEAVINISPEDDKALTGVLTADSYTNEYFGIRFNKCEGGTIASLMDEGTDLMPLSEAYANEIGAILIRSTSGDEKSSAFVNVCAVPSGDLGKDEEELAQERYNLEQSINSASEYEAEASIDQITRQTRTGPGRNDKQEI